MPKQKAYWERRKDNCSRKYHFFDREPDRKILFKNLHSKTRFNLLLLTAKGFEFEDEALAWWVKPDVQKRRSAFLIRGTFHGRKVEYWRCVFPSGVYNPTFIYIEGFQRSRMHHFRWRTEDQIEQLIEEGSAPVNLPFMQPKPVPPPLPVSPSIKSDVFFPKSKVAVSMSKCSPGQRKVKVL